ncbi:glycosyltransferase [Dialister hominis]|uniref:glycosyltransferase n=1 Tax=Dialister hominis TaxID=2582419 RepID=UPI0035224B5D
MRHILEVNVDDRGYGGVFAFVLNVLESIDHQKFILDVCTFEKFDDERHKDRFIRYGGRVFDCWGTGNFIKKQFQTCLKFYRMLKEHPYETAHIHSDVAYKLLLYGLAAKIGGVKTVIVHSHSTGIDGRHRSIKKILQKTSRPILSRTNFLKFACSKQAAQWMYESPEEAHIIRNGIVTKKFIYSVETREKVRKELGIRDEYLVGTVGRFSYQKNPFFELEIIKCLFQKGENAKFLWIGSGDLQKEIEEKARAYGIYNRIIFLGNTEHVNEYYQAMDAFLFPSLFEGLCFVGIEAQAAGLPCFFSDTITREVGITDLAHFISLKKKPEEWAEMILSESKVKRKNMEEEIIKAGYDIRREIGKLEKFYEGENEQIT